MDGRYTVDYLLDPAHEDDLRRLAGEVLGPWNRTVSLPDIAEQLLQRFQSRERYLIFDAIPKVHEFAKGPGFCSADEREYKYAMWFLWATRTERIVCCLAALLPEKVRIDK